MKFNTMVCMFLAVLAMLATGAPAPSNWLQARQCVRNPGINDRDCDYKLPTLLEIIVHYQDTKDRGRAAPGIHAWFYTNLFDEGEEFGTVFAWCLTWLFGNAGVDRANEDNFLRQGQDFAVTESLSDIFNRCAFEAASYAALEPVAYLFTKHGELWRERSVWAEVEFPALTQNPNIKTVWRVDPVLTRPRAVPPRLCGTAHGAISH